MCKVPDLSVIRDFSETYGGGFQPMVAVVCVCVWVEYEGMVDDGWGSLSECDEKISFQTLLDFKVLTYGRSK